LSDPSKIVKLISKLYTQHLSTASGNGMNFNSLITRILLAIIGGILYALLTYRIILLLGLPEFTVPGGFFVFLLYFGSRMLILLSGINTPYYSKVRKNTRSSLFLSDSFYQTTQWVGTFYHYHDIALFAFLVAISLALLITLMMDWPGAKPFGGTFQNIFNS
jgi:hypothetical protein